MNMLNRTNILNGKYKKEGAITIKRRAVLRKSFNNKNIPLRELKRATEIALLIDDIAIKNKTRKYVKARTFYAVLAERYSKNSLQITGDVIGRDHATILHLRKTHQSDMLYADYKEEWKDFLIEAIKIIG